MKKSTKRSEAIYIDKKAKEWQDEMILEKANEKAVEEWEKEQETPNWSFDVEDWMEM